MNSIGESRYKIAILGKYMKERNITAEYLSKSLDRAISKELINTYMTGKRKLLKDKYQYLDKINTILALSKNEKEELYQAVILDNEGEYKYNALMKIKDFIYQITRDEEYLNGMRKGYYGHEEIDLNVSTLSGKSEIRSYLIQLALNNDKINIVTTSSDMEIFERLIKIFCLKEYKQVNHLVMAENSKNQLVNKIDMLMHMVRVGYLCKAYRPYFIYGNDYLEELSLFPYMVFTDDHLFCFSKDVSSAIVFHKGEAMYKATTSAFDRIIKKYTPVFDVIHTKMSNPKYNELAMTNSIMHVTPCASMILDYSIMSKNSTVLTSYLKNEEAMEEAIQLFMSGDSIKLKNKIYSTKQGLHYLATEGMIYDIPRVLCNPTHTSMRRQFIQRFKQQRKSYKTYVFDVPEFSVNSTVQISFNEKLLAYSFLDKNMKRYIINIKDQDIIDIYLEYMNMLSRTSALTDEEIDKYIDYLIDWMDSEKTI